MASQYKADFIPILICLVVSALSFFSARAVVNWIDQDKITADALAQKDAWIATAQRNIEAFEAFADGIESQSEIDEDEFREQAQSLLTDHDFMSVEWLPRVSPADRAMFEQQVSDALGQEIRITSLVNGQRQPAAYDIQTFPVRFVIPAQLAKSVIGLHRPQVPAMGQAVQQGEAALTSRRTFYPELPPQLVAFRVVRQRSRGQTVATDRLRGLVAATFVDNPFGILPSFNHRNRTVARVLDVTLPQERVIAANHRLPNSQDQPIVWSAAFSCQQRIYRFDFVRNPKFRSRLGILPWLALLLGPVLALVWGGGRGRRTRQLVAANQHLQQQVSRREEEQRALRSLLEFRERERLLVASEIHDGFVQEALGAQMFLESLAVRLDDADVTAKDQLNQALELLRRSIAEGRQLMNELKPAVVEQLGLLPAIRRLLHEQQGRFGLSVSLRHCPDFPDLHVNTQRTLYRIIQESLSNVNRHSGAKEASICLRQDEDWIVLVVKDLGRGFDPGQVEPQSFGLRSIRQRANLLHGDAFIESSPGSGTTITVRVPLRKVSSDDIVSHQPNSPTADSLE